MALSRSLNIILPSVIGRVISPFSETGINLSKTGPILLLSSCSAYIVKCIFSPYIPSICSFFSDVSATILELFTSLTASTPALTGTIAELNASDAAKNPAKKVFVLLIFLFLLIVNKINKSCYLNDYLEQTDYIHNIIRDLILLSWPETAD